VWTFWQDLGQLRLLYPQDWTTILHNSAVVQAFGLTNGLMARECADVLGVSAEQLRDLRRGEQVLQLPRKGARVVSRLDYLRDSLFEGLYDANPWFASRAGRERNGGPGLPLGQG
jgi:type IV secretion system protein VirD4